jgi:hypothetical protein
MRKQKSQKVYAASGSALPLAISKFLVILFINLQGVLVLVSVQSHEWTAAA